MKRKSYSPYEIKTKSINRFRGVANDDNELTISDKYVAESDNAISFRIKEVTSRDGQNKESFDAEGAYLTGHRGTTSFAIAEDSNVWIDTLIYGSPSGLNFNTRIPGFGGLVDDEYLRAKKECSEWWSILEGANPGIDTEWRDTGNETLKTYNGTDCYNWPEWVDPALIPPEVDPAAPITIPEIEAACGCEAYTEVSDYMIVLASFPHEDPAAGYVTATMTGLTNRASGLSKPGLETLIHVVKSEPDSYMNVWDHKNRSYTYLPGTNISCLTEEEHKYYAWCDAKENPGIYDHGYFTIYETTCGEITGKSVIQVMHIVYSQATYATWADETIADNIPNIDCAYYVPGGTATVRTTIGARSTGTWVWRRPNSVWVVAMSGPHALPEASIRIRTAGIDSAFLEAGEKPSIVVTAPPAYCPNWWWCADPTPARQFVDMAHNITYYKIKDTE